MADSIRQQIIDAIDTKFKTILISNDYETDLGNNVSAWKSTAVSSDTTEELIYRDTEAEVLENVNQRHNHQLEVEAEVVAIAGSTTAAQLRKMIADIIKAIGADPQWSGLAIDTKIIGHEMSMEQKEKIVGGATVRFQVYYRTNLFEI